MAANILVVEDDLLNRDLICKVLRKEGYKVVEACDGAIALEILQVLPFDLVITDFMMPKLNGIEFVEHLHSLQPRIPIIFITGFLSVISSKTILDDVAEVLAKPFELDVLRSTVHRLLDSTPYSAP
jgi:two-component system, cell cycle sensor histidine kinase and response regulator CckA